MHMQLYMNIKLSTYTYAPKCIYTFIIMLNMYFSVSMSVCSFIFKYIQYYGSIFVSKAHILVS